MKILAFGDIYGRVGRRAFLEEYPRMLADYSPDFTIVNIDNITGGRGTIEKHAREIIDAGVDIVTWWDHIIDNLTNISDYLDAPDSPLLRPDNIVSSPEFIFPWLGHKLVEKNGKRLLVIHLLGHAFIDKFRCHNVFLHADMLLEQYRDQNIDHIIIDFHKEATAEIQGLAHYLDGRISAIFGTHTHVQTNDALILPQGTWIITDAGMSWPLYGVIGADFDSVKKMFVTGIMKWKIEQSLDHNYRVNGVLFELDDEWKCSHVEALTRIWKL